MEKAEECGREAVAVLLTSHNEESWIEAAFASVVAQDWAEFELVLADNASTDGTWRKLASLRQAHRGPQRMTLLRQPRNLGVAANLGAAAAATTATILVRACGDDLQMPQRLSATVEAFRSNPGVLAVVGAFRTIDETGDCFVPLAEFPAGASDPSVPRMKRLLDLIDHKANNLSGCAVAYRRILFDAFPPLPEGLMFDDQVMSFRCWLLGSGLFLNRHLVDYRAHAANLTALSRALSERPVEERRKIESLETVAARRKIDALHCYARDLRHARQQRLTSGLDWDLLECRIGRSVRRLETRRHWWDWPWWKRLARYLFAMLALDGGFPLAWATPRLLPLEVYVRVRPVAGNVKRWLRAKLSGPRARGTQRSMAGGCEP